jgi:hypothetical protein
MGWWLDTLLSISPSIPDYILCHDNGTAWTSHYFRYTYVYPLLALQRTLRDAYLAKFDESLGKGFAKNY